MPPAGPPASLNAYYDPFSFADFDMPASQVTIFTGGNNAIHADSYTVEHILPTLAHQVRFSGTIDGGWLFNELRGHLAPYNIPSQSIRNSLLTLFRLLKSSFYPLEHFNYRLSDRLARYLDDDLSHFINTSGLYRCRRLFLTLACLAEMTESRRLAKALALAFLDSLSDGVMASERTMWLEEWGNAFEMLSSLLSPRLLDQCEYVLSNRYNHGRGRPSHRKMIMYEPPRSRTVAPITHRRQFLLPPTAGSMIRSPSADYALTPTYGTADQQLQALVYNQNAMVQNQYAMQNQLGNIEAAVTGNYM